MGVLHLLMVCITSIITHTHTHTHIHTHTHDVRILSDSPIDK